jgi:hypothetical protein
MDSSRLILRQFGEKYVGRDQIGEEFSLRGRAIRKMILVKCKKIEIICVFIKYFNINSNRPVYPVYYRV